MIHRLHKVNPSAVCFVLPSPRCFSFPLFFFRIPTLNGKRSHLWVWRWRISSVRDANPSCCLRSRRGNHLQAIAVMLALSPGHDSFF
ncbi:hypothetical protein M5K25_006410 [Dendrobium thyrsiflorum]|uniref:Secreted protein n=1 Tax=Dendrobium thyrsiflorum TaxID=117978 RepID=A0ABD0VBI4_DENTH